MMPYCDLSEKKKGNITLTPFEEASENSQRFAINMYTFYLFQKSCSDLIMADRVIEKAIEISDDIEEIERLSKEYQKNKSAWDMIMKFDALSGSACYAEA